MAEPTGIDALAAGLREECGPSVEERIALALDPQEMSVRQLLQSVRILRDEVLRLRAEQSKARERAAAEERGNSAIDWLLNSRYMDSEAITAFWGVVDGRWSVEDADRGFIDGRSLTEIEKEEGDHA